MRESKCRQGNYQFLTGENLHTMQHSSISLSTWRQKAITQLSSSETPVLDIDLFINKITGLSPAQIRYQDAIIAEETRNKLNVLLQRRQQGEPVAYILGYQPFYDINLRVTSDTLIPRPETEHLVEKALSLLPENTIINVADLGTGSGAIAITIAKHRPNIRMIAIDKSLAALMIAQRNAHINHVKNIHFIHSHWCNGLQNDSFQLIVSNPPYISPDDEHLCALKYEPISALSAEKDGYADIFYLLQNTHRLLHSNGHLLLEHGYQQAPRIQQYAKNQNLWKSIHSEKDYAGSDRITLLQRK